MAEVNPCWALQNRADHPGNLFRKLLQALRGQQGVVATGDLGVTQNGSPNMSVNVAAGKAVVDGTENPTVQGSYLCHNDAVKNLTVAASDPTNPRWDLVIAKVQDAEYSGGTNAWALAVVTGTPAPSPADPAVPNNAIKLARIVVAANAVTIVNANITDLRTYLLQQIIGSPAGRVYRDSTNSQNNVAWDDAGIVTLRNQLRVPPAAGAALPQITYGTLPVKIDEVGPLGSAQATLPFPSGGGALPTGFRHLEVRYVVRGTQVAQNTELLIQLNADTGLNYAQQRQAITGVAATIPDESGVTNKNGWRAIYCPAANAPAGWATHGSLYVPLYNQTNFRKICEVRNYLTGKGAFPTAAQFELEFLLGGWNSTAAITAILFSLLSGNFDVGSYAELWGYP